MPRLISADSARETSRSPTMGTAPRSRRDLHPTANSTAKASQASLFNELPLIDLFRQAINILANGSSHIKRPFPLGDRVIDLAAHRQDIAIVLIQNLGRLVCAVHSPLYPHQRFIVFSLLEKQIGRA